MAGLRLQPESPSQPLVTLAQIVGSLSNDRVVRTDREQDSKAAGLFGSGMGNERIPVQLGASTERNHRAKKGATGAISWDLAGVERKRGGDSLGQRISFLPLPS